MPWWLTALFLFVFAGAVGNAVLSAGWMFVIWSLLSVALAVVVVNMLRSTLTR